MSGGVPVFVMLPLDTVNADGVFAYASSPWFTGALTFLSSSGVKGVAIDCWVVMSFHACGSNVNDTVSIPLPEWVLEAGKKEPDLFFMDRPRDGSMGRRNHECVSFFADDVKCLEGRTPLECYHDMMAAFSGAMSDMIGPVIEEVVVGTGPCGELRYPSYVERNGWKFPGVGEFQCYDRRALASLARAAQEAGHPEWGLQGPDGTGDYNNLPHETPFFSWNGGWQTPQGDFFLRWYSAALVLHGQRVLDAAVRVFFPYMYDRAQQRIRERGVVRVDNLPSTPPFCARAESDAALWQSDRGTVPSDLGLGTLLFGSAGGDAARGIGKASDTVPLIRAVSPNPTQLSSVHSQRSMPTGLCDLVQEAGEPVAEADDSGEGVTLHWDEHEQGRGMHTPSPAKAAPADVVGLDWAAGGAANSSGARHDSFSGGGIASAHGSMRNMTWKGARAGEMPALPEAEPLRHASTTPRGGVGRRGGGLPRGAVKSEPSLFSGDEGSHRNGGCVPMDHNACSTSCYERIRSLNAATAGSDDGPEGGTSGDVVAPSLPTSCSSSFMSLASAADVRRDSSSSLLMSVKIAGVHWWYHTPSHAAELTAGYYNTSGHDGYHDIIRMCADYGAEVILTCVEMCDAQHPPDALCGPEALLRQVREGAHQAGLLIAGENALPCISRHGVNTYALEHIVKNSHALFASSPRPPLTHLPPDAPDVARNTAAHQQITHAKSDRVLWKPLSHKAASMDGNISGGHVPASRLFSSVSPAATLSHRVRSDLYASTSQAMRKATSWIDLNGRAAESLWSPVASAGNTPAGRPCRSAPRNQADPDVAWSTCEGHLTMPYSMGSAGDLTDAGSGGGFGSWGGNSAPLLPLLTTARSDQAQQSGGGQVSPVKVPATSSVLSDTLPSVDPSPEAAADAPAGTVLPPLRMFTFLRLCPEMLHPGHSGQWLHFMRRMTHNPRS